MSNGSSSGGIGFMGVLTIVFVVLKLVGTITWSWWWVLAPLWMPLTIVLGLSLGALVIALYTQRG